MLSPTMTVVVLAVLWLIVVVPMVVRRSDEAKRERSVTGFGRAMRALGRRTSVTDAEVFVPTANAPAADRSQPSDLSTRQPVPAAEEALMYPVDRSEMSEARARMMARRRRSLTILGIGTAILLPLALMTGGVTWLLALPFTLGLAGYLWFLRSQAIRDRDRRYNRMQRALERRVRSTDLTAGRDSDGGSDWSPPESVVRIDDDDLELHSMDTIDLTGLYSEEREVEVAQRRAS
jgi:hypothetical protein